MKKVYIIFSLISISLATTINIPNDYPTIQLGINNAFYNDTILVSSGTYYESITWPETNINVISENGSSETIIDASNQENTSVVKIQNSPDVDTTGIFKGFTLRNADFDGMDINGNSPKLIDLIIENNFQDGLYVEAQWKPLHLNNVIIRNNGYDQYIGFRQFYGSYITNLTMIDVIIEKGINNHNQPVVLLRSIEGVFNFQNVTISNHSNSSSTLELRFANNFDVENIKVIHTGLFNHNAAITITESNNTRLKNFLIFNHGYGGTGIRIERNSDVSSAPIIDNCTVMNFYYGIHITNEWESTIATINNSNISGNNYGLYNQNIQQFINAENNWWGDITGPYHQTYNSEGLGDSTNIYVDVMPFLTTPDTTAPIPPISNINIDSSGTDFVDISWSPSYIGDLVGYRVYVDSIQYDVGLDTFYTLSGLTLGQEYDVSVTCFDNSGEESWSSEHIVVSPLSVPIIFAPAYISFGYVFIGGSLEFPLEISNNGTETLNISDIYTDSPEFQIIESISQVAPSSTGEITISYTPTNFGLTETNLTIISDAYNEQQSTVILVGFGDTPPNPKMLSVEDVPDDQGGQVRIEFERSKFDGLDTTDQIISYTVWREIDDNDWDAVGMFNATQDSIYYFVAPTLCDSTFEGICLSTYKVSAHTDDANTFFWSDSMSGYSIDNIAPAIPTGLMATTLSDGIILHWNESVDDDFHYFILEKSNDSEFPNYETIHTIDTTYNDIEFEIDQPNYYRLSVSDYTGNVSGYSEVIEATILSIDENLIPEVFALHQNYPNPFNPITSLRYDLPEDGLVNVIIYDMMGRVVKTILNSSQTAGYKSVQWNATNDRNEPVSAGLYLYTIQAGEFRQTKKMILLK